MKLDDNSKKIILKKSEFLLHNNFKLIEITDATITFSNKKIAFVIGYERYDIVSNINIKFLEENEMFNLGWIAFVRRNQIPLPQNKLDNILELLDYAEKNYSKVTNLQFCQESRGMVEDFLKE
ncbi:hypothetical protein ABW380_000018 [Listeria innocua]|uniref:hypothetical protein n=1 Tax=Listeria innocua TaxID=1642 RepID=UPI0010F005A5|nr:hypothetical protein [Listeria innocua]EDO1167509.1 hypothetical protein [Listeria innocua]EDO1170680.1 hypothetical protein [Listeria innocua]EHF3609195.1 hypothetical protein [Listeria innocua]EIB7772054.1 hypothetical protein [Listeria innocua]EIR7349109.1 hypothetical protein [Listeria innocua]